MPITKIELKLIDLPSCYICGRKTTVEQGKTATKFVGAFLRSDEYLQLNRIDKDLYIWMGDFNPQTKSFIELPGIKVDTISDDLSTFDYKEIKPCMLAMCYITGTSRDITRGAHNKLLKELVKTDYVADYSYSYSMELYPYTTYGSN